MRFPVATLITYALFFGLLELSPRVAESSSLPAVEASSHQNKSPESQAEIVGPFGSGQFGGGVTVLPNGNIVVIDRLYDVTTPTAIADVGAVYLYDGNTLALISQLTGSSANDQVGDSGVTVLSNGNFVVNSRNWNGAVGAVTWCSGTTGLSGTVSAGNSLVGSFFTDSYSNGVTALTNGNYVVRTPSWGSGANDFGAATWGNGTSGVSGVISSSNSLVGTIVTDSVGIGGVTALPNGNYVVSSPNWGSLSHFGAVTFGNGTTGISGGVSSANSIVGSHLHDHVGLYGITVLTNGNYVVNSYDWDAPGGGTDAGAVTFGSGTAGVTGVVSSANSLVGSSASDFVGWAGVYPLPNGNYVVDSYRWAANDLGAVTWGSGTSGVSGVVSAGNSLVGSTTNDSVGRNGIASLVSGNYVVSSEIWGANDIGAVTWCNGVTGMIGAVSESNSLTGVAAGDKVGTTSVALTNGHYVVRSPAWNNGPLTFAGAVTWCNGTSATIGKVTTANSLVGSQEGDNVGDIDVVPLTNGNYVVNSRHWQYGPISLAGAATWRNGFGPSTGVVSSANSLVGSANGDMIGRGSNFGTDGVVALTNGNYVVNTPSWSQGNGAVTWGNGSTGTSGEVTIGNSLIGIRPPGGAGDTVGNGGVHALSNGNYVVRTRYWGPNDEGAITWGNGNGGIAGIVSAVNSLVGTSPSDIAYADDTITELPNGNYIVDAPFWGVGGAVAYGAGNGGTIGPFTTENAVLGTVADGFVSFATTLSHERLVGGRANSNVVTIFNPTYRAVADGNWSNAATWNYGAFSRSHDVVVPNSRNVFVNTNVPGGTVTVDSGGSLLTSGNRSSAAAITVNGVMDVSLGRLDMMTNVLEVGCTGVVNGAGPNGYVIGSTRKNFCAPSAFAFPTGTANGFSPVDANVSAIGVSPSSLAINATQSSHPILSPLNSLRRYWSIAETGDVTVDLVFHYNDPLDVAGAEATYKLFRIVGATPTLVPGFLLDTSGNTMSASNVSTFSDWAIGNLPAASVSVGGRVPRPDGRGVAGALVTMTDPSNATRYAVTNPFGYYRFRDVANGFNYTFAVRSKSFSYAPRNVVVTNDLTDLDFVPEP